MAALFWTVLLPLDFVQPALEAARKHNELTKGRSKHGLGPPHPHVWLATLKMLLKEAKEKCAVVAATEIQVVENYVQ